MSRNQWYLEMRYLPCIKKYFQNLQGLLRNLSPIFKTFIQKRGIWTTRKKHIQNPQQMWALYVIMFHDNCMKNKALCTLLETTIDYSPNWWSGQEIYLQLDAVQPVALWLLGNEVSFVIVMKYVSHSWWLPLTLLLYSQHRTYITSGSYL